MYSANLDLRTDEAIVLGHLESVVALLVPGFSVLQTWQSLGGPEAAPGQKLRDAIIHILDVLDRHCPDPTLLTKEDDDAEEKQQVVANYGEARQDSTSPISIL